VLEAATVRVLARPARQNAGVPANHAVPDTPDLATLRRQYLSELDTLEAAYQHLQDALADRVV
jgi:hypothetical protein